MYYRHISYLKTISILAYLHLCLDIKIEFYKGIVPESYSNTYY